MPGAPLVEIIYISAATAPLSGPALADLLTTTRRNNVRVGATGLLIHSEGSFLQVLEGTEDVVDPNYERILQDPRHTRVVRISRRRIEARSFGDWTMGFVADVPGARVLEGFNDFFNVGLKNARLSAEPSERAREVVEQFARGHWRQHVR